MALRLFLLTLFTLSFSDSLDAKNNHRGKWARSDRGHVTCYAYNYRKKQFIWNDDGEHMTVNRKRCPQLRGLWDQDEDGNVQCYWAKDGEIVFSHDDERTEVRRDACPTLIGKLRQSRDGGVRCYWKDAKENAEPIGRRHCPDIVGQMEVYGNNLFPYCYWVGREDKGARPIGKRFCN